MAALRSANGLPPLGPGELAKLAHGMSLDPAVLNALDISLSSQEALHRGPPAVAAHALPPRPMQALSHESVSHVMCCIVARPWGGGDGLMGRVACARGGSGGASTVLRCEYTVPLPPLNLLPRRSGPESPPALSPLPRPLRLLPAPPGPGNV